MDKCQHGLALFHIRNYNILITTPVIKTRSPDQDKKHLVIRSTGDNPPLPTSPGHAGLRSQTHGLYVKSGAISLKVRNVEID